MKSVADRLRADRLGRESTRTAAERIHLALSLGQRDVRLLMASRRITGQEARRLFGRQRQHGRQRSPCHEGLFA